MLEYEPPGRLAPRPRRRSRCSVESGSAEGRRPEDRLRNLRLVSEAEFRHLKALDEEGRAKQLAMALGLSEADHAEMRSEFKHRFLGLALEAYRREEISRGKLREFVAMVKLTDSDLEQLLDGADLGGEDDPTP